jgi:serine/threonine protein kinase
MAEIYLGFQNLALGMSKPVVIKRLKPALVGDVRATQMFEDEARLMALLSHGHVVHCHDVGEDGGVPFIVMEYIRGQELNQLARRGLQVGHFLPRALAVELIRQAALGLGYCHALLDDAGGALELVHCDLSPNNLLVTEDGAVKVIDFGIAQFAGQSLRGSRAVPGKLSYMSPEQARREPVDFRSDIFSLGVMLYELTLGQRLYRGKASEVLERLARAEVPPPTFVDNDYPGHLEGVVMKALELHPSERYQSCYQLADELARYLVAAEVPVGEVEVARYLDSLAQAHGELSRPELEVESTAAGDELDFDRAAAPGELPLVASFDVGLWDELDEADDAVALALGIDADLVRHQARRVDGQGELAGRIAVPIEDESSGEDSAGAAS